MSATIKCGDVVRIKPEWQDPGDDRFIWRALEDEDGGRVMISPTNTGLAIPPNQVVTVDMIEVVQSQPGPLVRLSCCCCGEAMVGRQWWNRDAGYGICAPCADRQSKRETAQTMASYYGERGTHYAVSPTEVRDASTTLASVEAEHAELRCMLQRLLDGVLRLPELPSTLCPLDIEQARAAIAKAKGGAK